MSSIGAVYRVALISDIHGNGIALREVLKSIERHGIDEIVCLGDVATLGIAPGEVIDTLQRIGCPCIMGNHDDYVLDMSLVDAHTDIPVIVDSIDWCRNELSSDQIEFVSQFDERSDRSLGPDHRLMLFHGSPSSNTVDLLSDTPSDEFDVQLGGERSIVMAGGHTHVQMVRQHRGSLVVNPGSVGAPFREFPNGGAPKILDHAEYASVEFNRGDVSVALHRVGLDRSELAKAALESSIPMSAELASAYR